MEHYNLISCNPSLYPDIECRAWETRHPLEGLIVYVTSPINGQIPNPTFTYELVYLGTNACVSNDWLPKLDPSFYNTCTPANTPGWEYINCETGESRVFVFEVQDPTMNVLRIDDSCDCWSLIGESNGAQEIASNYNEYGTCFDCIKARDAQVSPTAERTISFATALTLPTPPVPDRGFKECCFKQIVFASLTDDDSYKNDFNGFYFKRPTSNSTVVFTLLDVNTQADYLLDDDMYGTFKDFGTGTQVDLSFVIVEWKKVLQQLGAGAYRIVKEVTIAGITESYPSNTFHLMPFSIDEANYTVRVEAVQDGEFTINNVDFYGTDFKSSLRFEGFFGREEREYEQTKLVNSSLDSNRVKTRIDKVYKLQATRLPACVSSYLMDFLIVGTRVKVSDYNKNNHSYEIVNLEVDFLSNDGTDYNELTRKATFNLSFSDRSKNNRILNCK